MVVTGVGVRVVGGVWGRATHMCQHVCDHFSCSPSPLFFLVPVCGAVMHVASCRDGGVIDAEGCEGVRGVGLVV